MYKCKDQTSEHTFVVYHPTRVEYRRKAEVKYIMGSRHIPLFLKAQFQFSVFKLVEHKLNIVQTLRASLVLSF